MDVLLILLGIVIGVILLLWLFIGIVYIDYIIWTYFPSLIGVVGGVWLWLSGHDNLSVALVLFGFVCNIFWIKRLADSIEPWERDYPVSDKVRIYDADGNVTGYQDRQ